MYKRQDHNKTKELLIRGVSVLGSVKDLDKIIDKLQFNKKNPQKIIITSNSLNAKDMSNVMKTVDAKGMTIGRAQSPNQLIEGSNINSQVKDITIMRENVFRRTGASGNVEAHILYSDGTRITISGNMLLRT